MLPFLSLEPPIWLSVLPHPNRRLISPCCCRKSVEQCTNSALFIQNGIPILPIQTLLDHVKPSLGEFQRMRRTPSKTHPHDWECVYTGASITSEDIQTCLRLDSTCVGTGTSAPRLAHIGAGLYRLRCRVRVHLLCAVCVIWDLISHHTTLIGRLHSIQRGALGQGAMQ